MVITPAILLLIIASDMLLILIFFADIFATAMPLFRRRHIDFIFRYARHERYSLLRYMLTVRQPRKDARHAARWRLEQRYASYAMIRIIMTDNITSHRSHRDTSSSRARQHQSR